MVDHGSFAYGIGRNIPPIDMVFPIYHTNVFHFRSTLMERDVCSIILLP